MRNIMKRTGMIVFMTILIIACAVLCQGKPAYAKVKLNKKTVYMAKGDMVQLRVRGTKKKAQWFSSKKSVCTVSKTGKVKAKKIGKATLTARIKGKNYSCKVIVEKKNVNRARKLRDYILSKKKNKIDEKTYRLSWNYDDGNNNTTELDITAYKSGAKKNQLDFHYRYHEESSYTNDVRLKINLISGTASVKTGEVVTFNDEDEDDIGDQSTVYGEITTKFDGKSAGLALNKAVWTVMDDESNEITKDSEDAEVLEKYMEGRTRLINVAFKKWNKMFSKKYTDLKKAGVNMKSIGFSKWSN